MAKRRGLPISGDKEAIITRLEESDAAAPMSSSDEEDSQNDDKTGDEDEDEDHTNFDTFSGTGPTAGHAAARLGAKHTNINRTNTTFPTTRYSSGNAYSALSSQPDKNDLGADIGAAAEQDKNNHKKDSKKKMDSNNKTRPSKLTTITQVPVTPSEDFNKKKSE